MGEAEHAEQQAGQRGRQRHGDQRRSEQIGVAGGDEPLDDGCDQRGEDDGGRTVRSGDGEGQRAAQRHDRAANGGRQEGHRDAVGQQVLERAGENERRVGQAIGDGQDAADRAGEHVRQSCAEFVIAQRDAHLRSDETYNTIAGAARIPVRQRGSRGIR